MNRRLYFFFIATTFLLKTTYSIFYSKVGNEYVVHSLWYPDILTSTKVFYFPQVALLRMFWYTSNTFLQRSSQFLLFVHLQCCISLYSLLLWTMNEVLLPLLFHIPISLKRFYKNTILSIKCRIISNISYSFSLIIKKNILHYILWRQDDIKKLLHKNWKLACTYIKVFCKRWQLRFIYINYFYSTS